jgi:hypothetical protein
MILKSEADMSVFMLIVIALAFYSIVRSAELSTKSTPIVIAPPEEPVTLEWQGHPTTWAK